MSRSLQSTPELTDIVSFKTSSGERIQILDQIGTHYSNFGILLLNDKNGAVVRYITYEHSSKAVAINRDILERWLAGEGKQPATWATLIDVLEDVQLNVLAETIKKNLTIPGM